MWHWCTEASTVGSCTRHPTRVCSRNERVSRLGDAGFALVEILVAITLFMAVMVAVLPQLVIGLRGTAQANQLSEVKGVAQARIETMRNLPYHVAPAVERRIDVLDTYYPDLAEATTAALPCSPGAPYTKPDPNTWTGYVPAAKRCSAYEPATGAFYRKVDDLVRPSGGVYTIVTDTQFMDSTATSPYTPTPLAPPTGYDSAMEGYDKPASSELAVTVTVFYLNKGILRLVSTYTQMSEVSRSPLRVEGKANAAAIEASSTDGDDLSLSLGAGSADLAGSLSSVSKVSATLAAIAARQSTNDALGPRVGPVVAPPTTTLEPALTDTAGGTMPSGAGCRFACWGASQIERFTASADSGLPVLTGGGAGDPLSPVEARGTGSALSFGKTATSSPSPYLPDLQLLAAQPMVSMATASTIAPTVCGASRGGSFTGRGYLRTTSTAVDTCAEAASAPLSLFPTTFAPGGIVRLTLNYAGSQCTVNPTTSTRTARYRYSFDVEYFDPVVAGYQKVSTVYDSSTGSALPAESLASLRGKVVKAAVGATPALTVGSYIAAWSSPTSPLVSAPKTTTTSAEASLPGVVQLVSQPLRPRRASQPVSDTVDPSSTLSLTLGSVSCFASDKR